MQKSLSGYIGKRLLDSRLLCASFCSFDFKQHLSNAMYDMVKMSNDLRI
jgi:hypothetical protein